MITYEEILDHTRELSSEERLRLADALLEEELGFGMWRHRAEIADVEAYINQMRDVDMCAGEGRLKSSAEFLGEVETFDE